MKILVYCPVGLLAASAATAEDFATGNIRIEHAASHAIMPGAKVGDRYLTTTSNGDQPDKLISASSDRARSARHDGDGINPILACLSFPMAGSAATGISERP